MSQNENAVFLAADSNQARGIAQYAVDFLGGKLGTPSPAVFKRIELFHTDSVVCGLSALAHQCNAPVVLRAEAADYPKENGATCFGLKGKVAPEKAILANASAVREWDSNGTVFGYNGALGKKHQAGEFGHNDFYPVVVAACQQKKLDGAKAALAMICLDEIRGRLAEVFSLKTFKIDHVVHGAIGSAAVYGALMGATVEQIESAIGMVVAHYIPFRAIRAGKQLSDSKGASAAISTEAAILSVQRSMRGFVGPADIFRNPESIFRLNMPTEGASPFNLVLSHSGDDFAVMGMHFKLGLYEHQSAGALQGAIDVIRQHPEIIKDIDSIESIFIKIYEPAFGIIGDPAKRDPHTRQSADHSMVFIVSSLFRKALALGSDKIKEMSNDETWKSLILTPEEYGKDGLHHPITRALMKKIEFVHGGEEYDSNYPDGIPTSIIVKSVAGQTFDSGLVMYPAGHARNTAADLEGILKNKFAVLGGIAVEDTGAMLTQLEGLKKKTAEEMDSIYNFEVAQREKIDAFY